MHQCFWATDSNLLEWLAVRTCYDRRCATMCKGIVAGESIHRRQATSSTPSTDPDFIGRIVCEPGYEDTDTDDSSDGAAARWRFLVEWGL